MPDPDFEIGPGGDALREHTARRAWSNCMAASLTGDGYVDALMRRAIWRAVRAGAAATGCRSAAGVGFKHLETFEIGDGVFIGAQAYIQGRFDGTCLIGDHVWIGPQATSTRAIS